MPSYFPSSYQSMSRENLEQLEKQLAISEIGVEICHLAVDLAEVRVDPLGEGLLLDVFTFD